jgi:hypothetical protein
MFLKCPKSGNMSETHGNPASCWGEEPLVYDGLWFNQLVFSVKIPL